VGGGTLFFANHLLRLQYSESTRSSGSGWYRCLLTDTIKRGRNFSFQVGDPLFPLGSGSSWGGGVGVDGVGGCGGGWRGVGGGGWWYHGLGPSGVPETAELGADQHGRYQFVG